MTVDVASSCCYCLVVELVDIRCFSARDSETMTACTHYQTENNEGEVIFNPLTARLFNLDFHLLEIVSRRRDPQLQVSENHSDLTKWRSTVFKYC